jgi:hypothetical protein
MSRPATHLRPRLPRCLPVPALFVPAGACPCLPVPVPVSVLFHIAVRTHHPLLISSRPPLIWLLPNHRRPQPKHCMPAPVGHSSISNSTSKSHSHSHSDSEQPHPRPIAMHYTLDWPRPAPHLKLTRFNAKSRNLRPPHSLKYLNTTAAASPTTRLNSHGLAPSRLVAPRLANPLQTPPTHASFISVAGTLNCSLDSHLVFV